ELGDGTTTSRSSPVIVPGLAGVTNVTAGLSHTCALRSNGTVACWGFNARGQAGNGTTTTPQLTPVDVQGLTDAVEIQAGDFFNSARRATGGVVCWGDTDLGQLGDGTTGVDRLTPVAVQGVSTAIAIAAGDEHACALLSGGSVVCWGKNLEGQLG